MNSEFQKSISQLNDDLPYYERILCQKSRNGVVKKGYEVSLNNAFIIEGAKVGKGSKYRCLRISNIVLAFLIALQIIIALSLVITLCTGVPIFYLALVQVVLGLLLVINAVTGLFLRIALEIELKNNTSVFTSA